MAAVKVHLEAMRLVKGWSQSELGRRSGVGQSTISRIERGETAGVSLGVLEKLAQALGIDDPAFLIVKKGK